MYEQVVDAARVQSLEEVVRRTDAEVVLELLESLGDLGDEVGLYRIGENRVAAPAILCEVDVEVGQGLVPVLIATRTNCRDNPPDGRGVSSRGGRRRTAPDQTHPRRGLGFADGSVRTRAVGGVGSALA